jgi:hypothetical protein
MREYIIQCIHSSGFELHRARYAEALRPLRIASQPIEGWGDHRIAVEGAEVSLSLEPPGYQVVFESGGLPPERQRAVVSEILESIERATGQRGRVIEL